jgi:hypothetical protein
MGSIEGTGSRNTWIEVHSLFIVTVIIIILHFAITSMIGHYISVQIGTQMGRVVATGLLENAEADGSEAGTYEGMKKDTESIFGSWKVPTFLISLPAKPLINPMLKKIRATRIQMLLSKKISKEQFANEGFIIDYTANFVNSLSFGVIVYVILRLFMTHRKT